MGYSYNMFYGYKDGYKSVPHLKSSLLKNTAQSAMVIDGNLRIFDNLAYGGDVVSKGILSDHSMTWSLLSDNYFPRVHSDVNVLFLDGNVKHTKWQPQKRYWGDIYFWRPWL